MKKTHDMDIKLQLLKGKRKLSFYQNIGNFYDEMTYRRISKTLQIEEDPFSENMDGINKIYHGVLILTKFFQTKPHLRTWMLYIMFCIILLFKKEMKKNFTWWTWKN